MMSTALAAVPRPAAHAAAEPPAILHVAAPAPVGGLERVVHALARGQAQRGHRVHVLAVLDPGAGDHPFLAGLRADGVPVTALRLPGRAYLRERREVAALCRQLGTSVVHTHGYRPDVVDGGVAGALGIARVSTVHGFCGGGWRNRAYERLQCIAYRRFDGVVAVSSPLAAQLERSGVPRARIHTIANAWAGTAEPLRADEARRRLGLDEDGCFRLAWVGRVSREKGLDVLLDALPLLADLPIRLSVLGDGGERAGLEARTHALGIADRVQWHGMVPDAARHLGACDAFVLSSRTEGTPIALFEAIAAGLPVVATRVGGVPEVVSSAEALLVPPEDPAALAAALRALVADPTNAETRAKAALHRLETSFASGPWLDRYDALYRSVQALRGKR
ncbi:MAG TPA: glycosyltransferase [Longimicrobium sp.]|jgi:glycosyltransferase involved in cell wall biosynthesis